MKKKAKRTPVIMAMGLVYHDPHMLRPNAQGTTYI